MNDSACFPKSLSHLVRKSDVFAVLVAVAAFGAPVAGFSQTASGSGDGNEALHNIQSNFARMTPPPRTVDSINQELKQGEAKSHTAAGGGRHGGGRRGMGRQSNQQSDTRQDGKSNPGLGSAEATANGSPGNTAGSATQ